MPTPFDPYHKWLGIPPKDQPPHHYRLLGIDLFEGDVEVIEAAANRQMTYIQGCATGEYVAESQQLMNEITAARITLLDPTKRAGYDRRLKQKLAAGGKLRVAASIDRGAEVQPPPVDTTPQPPPPKPPLAKPKVSPPSLRESPPNLPATPPLASKSAPARRKVKLGWQFPVFIGLLLLMIGGGIAVWLFLPQLIGGEETSLGGSDPATEGREEADAADDAATARVDQPPERDPPPAPENSGGGRQTAADDGGPITDTRPVDPPESGNRDQKTTPPKSPPDGGEPGGDGPFPAKRPGGIDPLGGESLDDIVDRIDRPGREAVDLPSPQPAEKPTDPPGEPEEQPAIKRQPVPAVAVLREARLQVTKELGKPPRNSDALRELARKLIERAQAAEDNAAVQYVLLESAGEWALDTLDLELAQAAADETSIRFKVDRIKLQADLLNQFARAVPRDQEKAAAALKRAIVEALDEAIEETRYDQADRLLVTIKTAAKRLRDENFGNLAASYRKEVQTGLSYYDAIRLARQTLAENPVDAVANLTLGRFYGTVRSDWGRAAGYLRHAEDDDLRKAAIAELSVPTVAEGQFAVAQAWGVVAGKASRPGGLAAAASKRSRHWLMQAWGNAKGKLKEGITSELKKSKVLVENTVGMQFVLVPAGEFVMGSPADEEGRGLQFKYTQTEIAGAKGKTREFRISETQHRVRISQPFYLSIYEVTQEQFELVTKRKPEIDGDNLPAMMVDWSETERFCKRLILRERQNGAKVHYRLPTEAEWEYACRAGTRTIYFYGDKLTTDHASFNRANEEKGLMPVGSFSPNAFGLYDMHGNVWEWVSDTFNVDNRFYDMLAASSRAAVDPRVPTPLVRRFKVLRGGGFNSPQTYCRSAARRAFSHGTIRSDLGFRVVMLTE